MSIFRRSRVVVVSHTTQSNRNCDIGLREFLLLNRWELDTRSCTWSCQIERCGPKVGWLRHFANSVPDVTSCRIDSTVEWRWRVARTMVRYAADQRWFPPLISCLSNLRWGRWCYGTAAELLLFFTAYHLIYLRPNYRTWNNRFFIFFFNCKIRAFLRKTSKLEV